MQKDTWIVVIAITVTLVLFGGAGAGYWYVSRPHKQVRQALGQSTESTDGSGSGASGQSSGGLSIQSQGSQSTGGGFSLQDNTNQPSSSSSGSSSTGEKQAPGPETFGEYEKYKNDSQILFGDILVGSGAEVTAGTKVAVKYKGWLTNGKLFDQSIDKAIAFTVGNHEVIPGWEQGLIGMKVGGKRRLIVPPAVGYGTQGKDPVPPNAVMVFDIELMAAL